MRAFHCGRRRFVPRVGVVACSILLASSVTAGAFAAERERAGALDCQTELQQAKANLQWVNGLLAQKVVLIRGKTAGKTGRTLFGITLAPVAVEQFTQFLTLEYASGDLTGKEYAGSLTAVGTLAAGARRFLTRSAGKLKQQISALETQCGGTVAASPPTPATHDLTLTITFQGVSEKRDEKTDAQSPPQGVTANVQSGNSYGGNVSVAGPFPAGDVVYVVFGPTIVAVLGPSGGGFSGISEAKGFGADTTVGAFVCKQGASAGQAVTATTGCLAEGDDISVQWAA